MRSLVVDEEVSVERVEVEWYNAVEASNVLTVVAEVGRLRLAAAGGEEVVKRNRERRLVVGQRLRRRGATCSEDVRDV